MKTNVYVTTKKSIRLSLETKKTKKMAVEESFFFGGGGGGFFFFFFFFFSCFCFLSSIYTRVVQKVLSLIGFLVFIPGIF